MSCHFGERLSFDGKGREADPGERAVLATIAECRRAAAIDLARASDELHAAELAHEARPCPSTAEELAQCRDAVAAARRAMGPKAITIELARAGLRNRHGRRFDAAAVARLLPLAEALDAPPER